MTYHLVYDKSNQTDATRREGIVNPSGVPEITPGFLVWFVLLNL